MANMQIDVETGEIIPVNVMETVTAKAPSIVIDLNEVAVYHNQPEVLIDKIRQQAGYAVFDISTDKGRKECRSHAANIIRCITPAIEASKTLANDAKKVVQQDLRFRKVFEDGVREIAAFHRKPLTEWEEEQDRIKEEARLAEEKRLAAEQYLKDWQEAIDYDELYTLRKIKEEADRKAEEERRVAEENERLERELNARMEHERKRIQAEEERKAQEQIQAEKTRLAMEAAEKERVEREARQAEERKRVAAETKRQLEEKAALQAELNKQAKPAEQKPVDLEEEYKKLGEIADKIKSDLRLDLLSCKHLYEEPSPGKEKLIAAIAKEFWTTNEIAERWLVEEFT